MNKFTFDEAFAYIEASNLGYDSKINSDLYRQVASWKTSKSDVQLNLYEKALAREHGTKFDGQLVLESFAPRIVISALESFLRRNGTKEEQKQFNLRLINKNNKYNQTLALLDSTMRLFVQPSYGIETHPILQYQIMNNFYSTISNGNDINSFLQNHIKILKLIKNSDKFMLTLITQGLILRDIESTQKQDLENRLKDFSMQLI